MSTPKLAVLGMGVMGKALAENFATKGYHTAIWNHNPQKAHKIAQEHAQKYTNNPNVAPMTAFDSLADLKDALPHPRIAIIMIPAGDPVDLLLVNIKNLWQPGDFLIDAGNSLYTDTIRRNHFLAPTGIHFIGMGVSGGEEGALKGPSIMPAAPPEQYQHIKQLLEDIAAKTDSGPCVTPIATDGAGHFVKMVHNGIEYADMQIIAEAYDLLAKLYRLSPPQLAETFEKWSKGPLSSYLIDITAQIFKEPDPDNKNQFLIDNILDRAGQKGTGRWTVQAALDLGTPIPAIAAAVDARNISNRWEFRQTLPKLTHSSPEKLPPIDAVHDAIYASKIIAYTQGMQLIADAAQYYAWEINLAEIARIWKGGCIIRAKLLDELMKIYNDNPKLNNLLENKIIADKLLSLQPNWRNIAALALQSSIPIPVLSTSLAYYDQLHSHTLPHNLLQAQRDFFGAHTFQKRNDPNGPYIHHIWNNQ